MASREPVEAPEGTAARPMTPDSSSTSHSTVGLPRLSRISRPTISTIALIYVLSKLIRKQKSKKLHTFNQHHAHDSDVLARLAGRLVLGRRIESPGLIQAGEFQHDHAAWRPVAFQHLDPAASHANFGTMGLHGNGRELFIRFVLFEVRNRDAGNDVGTGHAQASKWFSR